MVDILPDFLTSELIDSLVWKLLCWRLGMSCALQQVWHHPWFLLTRCQFEHSSPCCDNQNSQTFHLSPMGQNPHLRTAVDYAHVHRSYLDKSLTVHHNCIISPNTTNRQIVRPTQCIHTFSSCVL